MRNKIIKNKNSGFTLIEVLITVVILSLGLLGLAGLQLNSLRDNNSAEQRGKAALLVSDMVDRMRANRDSNNVAQLADYTNAAAQDASCETMAGCSRTALAGHDKFEWEREIANSLPLGQGSVSVAGAVFTVRVAWDDNRDGVVDASDASFSASFEP